MLFLRLHFAFGSDCDPVFYTVILEQLNRNQTGRFQIFLSVLVQLKRKFLYHLLCVLRVYTNRHYIACILISSYADRCALFFDGDVVTTNPPRQFFASNSFYTTAANRISRGFFENVVTVEEVVELCRS